MSEESLKCCVCGNRETDEGRCLVCGSSELAAPTGYAADAAETMLQAVIDSISRKAVTMQKENRINDACDLKVWARHLAWVRNEMRHNGEVRHSAGKTESATKQKEL